MKKISIIGQGYVGLTLAISASKYFNVIGFDNKKDKIELLRKGFSYVEDVSTSELKEAISNGSYFPSDEIESMSDSDIYVICVPTPLDSNRKPDMSFIESACKAIGKTLTKSALIINESTSFPGTLRNFIKPLIEEETTLDLMFAAAPERVDPGRLDFKVNTTPRLLAGINEESKKAAVEFYEKFCTDLILVKSPEVAETAKLFENTFRQVNIALVNELAIICKSIGISVYDVLSAAETKPYGFMRFNPGPGVGGHCIPVDPSYLAYSANQVGVSARFIQLSNEINLEMPKYIVDRCEIEIGNLKDKKILIAGVSYKGNISDTRETPAEAIYELLESKGASVSWYDPLVEVWKENKISDPNVAFFDLTVLQVLHDTLDLDGIRKNSRMIFDCTGKLKDSIQL